jgi:ATP-dependent Clp protease adaptor protein ClpS
MDTVVEEQKKTTSDINKPKVVILHNDDFNTFEHVENCLISICKMDIAHAKLCAIIVHTKGKCIVAEGDEDYLKKIKLQLKSKGLTVTIEDA